MTTWLPDLNAGEGPLYIRLAERIEDAIENGDLTIGTKLPPQRNLAYDLGVTVGTVGRAYSIVRERGLVSGEVGRGTYVSDRGDVVSAASRTSHFSTEANSNTPEGYDSGEMIRFDASAAPLLPITNTLERMTAEILRDHPQQASDYIRAVAPSWTQAGVKWLSNRHWRPDPANIAPVQGVHSGIVAIIAAMTVPGDRIAVEELSYANVPRAAQMMGRRPVSVPIDQYGAIPDALEHICAQQHPKIVFLMPAQQNPTLAVMPEERRHQIAMIARRYNLLIIEDNVYGCLHEDPAPPLAALAPDLTFHISG
ncbi:MAG: PLP-dependent aminotransferase family protein, partial [Oricola sp.]